MDGAAEEKKIPWPGLWSATILGKKEKKKKKNAGLGSDKTRAMHCRRGEGKEAYCSRISASVCKMTAPRYAKDEEGKGERKKKNAQGPARATGPASKKGR